MTIRYVKNCAQKFDQAWAEIDEDQTRIGIAVTLRSSTEACLFHLPASTVETMVLPVQTNVPTTYYPLELSIIEPYVSGVSVDNFN